MTSRACRWYRHHAGQRAGPAGVPGDARFDAAGGEDAAGPAALQAGWALATGPYGTQAIIVKVVERCDASLLAPCNSKVPGSGLGKVRFVIERTLSWMGNYRRLKLCYERTGEHWQGMNELATCIICANRIQLLRAQGKIAA